MYRQLRAGRLLRFRRAYRFARTGIPPFGRWRFYRRGAFTALSVILRKLDVGDLRSKPVSNTRVRAPGRRCNRTGAILRHLSLSPPLPAYNMDRKLDVADLRPNTTQQRLDASRSSVPVRYRRRNMRLALRTKRARAREREERDR